MVRDVFRLARENSPAIIFIDEVDAIGTKRFDSQTVCPPLCMHVSFGTDVACSYRARTERCSVF
jgi:hypothetical protein